MRAKLPVLVLMCSLLPVAMGSADDARPRLRLVWIDPTAAASFAYAGVRGEVQSILRAAGVDAEWDKRPAGFVAAGDIAVIVLDAEPARVALRPNVMGCVIKGDGRSVLWVNLATVAQVLGLHAASRSSWSGEQRQQVATALGRVVAHEVVHAIAPELPHAARGLLSATLTASQLVHQRLRLDADSAGGFRQKVLLRRPLEGPELASTLVP
jgi:hypothetical protein